MSPLLSARDEVSFACPIEGSSIARADNTIPLTVSTKTTAHPVFMSSSGVGP